MHPNFPEQQWPPALPHEQSSVNAWEAAFETTRKMLLETNHKQCRKRISLLRSTTLAHLILQFEKTTIRRRPFAIIHGIAHPASNAPRRAFLVRPPEQTLEMLNNMDPLDLKPLIVDLCYEYATNVWGKLHPDEVVEHVEDSKPLEEDEEKEPWAISYEWEEPPAAAAGLLVQDPKFLEFMEQQMELRKLYAAILSQQLTGKDVLLIQ